MTIEATLQSIDAKLGTLIGLFQSGNAIGLDQSGIAGAGAEPAVAQQVNDAIADAGVAAPAAPAPTQRRGRGRPPKTEQAAPAPAPAAPAPAAPQPDPLATNDDPFSLDGGIDTGPKRTLNEVRAALVIYQAKHSQPEALKLMKSTTDADTLQQLKEDDYGKLFRAALPADKIDIADVRLVLVQANERVPNSGRAILQKFGANTIAELAEDKFADAVLAAHAVK